MAEDILPTFPQLANSTTADVCIVGAGIAGLTTAYLLVKSGKSVVVLDDGAIASGETERTTAHLSSALDDRYYELERLHGKRGAELAAESHTAAIAEIERIVIEEKIACDFSRLNGYLFKITGESDDLLVKEMEAARRAGISGVQFVPRIPVAAFDSGPALCFPQQAQFDPLKYLAALATAITRQGGRIFSHTRATNMVGGKSSRVETESGLVVSCDAIVIATNTPVNDRLVIHTKQAPYRTLVIGLEIPSGAIPTALFWDTGDPYHYVRLQRGGSAQGQDVLIVGGEDYKTGQANDDERRYAALEEWTASVFP